MGYDKRNNNYKNKQEPIISPEDYALILNMHKTVNHALINKIEKFVRVNSQKKHITTSQLRNIFRDVKDASLQELPLKRPKLAYIAGRTDKNKIGMHNLLKLLDNLLRKIGVENIPENHEKHKGFLAFFEAVLAYHKYYDK